MKQIDMKAPYIIDVTQRHINSGQQQNCSSCPIALATQEHFKALGFKVETVSANQSEIYIRIEYGEDIYEWQGYKFTPQSEVSDWIQTFDKHGHTHVAPFKFTIREPRLAI